MPYVRHFCTLNVPGSHVFFASFLPPPFPPVPGASRAVEVAASSTQDVHGNVLLVETEIIEKFKHEAAAT